MLILKNTGRIPKPVECDDNVRIVPPGGSIVVGKVHSRLPKGVVHVHSAPKDAVWYVPKPIAPVPQPAPKPEKVAPKKERAIEKLAKLATKISEKPEETGKPEETPGKKSGKGEKQ